MLAIRHKLYDFGILPSKRGALPTLVVGNVELGGTGKTPHVIDIARRLQSMIGDGAVGILSRGYGRSSSGFLWVNQAHGWRDVGDEPWMIQQQLPAASVAVCENRLAGLSRMHQERPELRIALLDDGMQHRALRADRVIALKSRPIPAFGMRWTKVVPAGPFRDLPTQFFRSDLKVSTNGVDATCDAQTSAQVGSPRPFSGDAKSSALNDPALLITGIAHPSRVVDAVGKLGLDVAGFGHYSDHHDFSEADIQHWLTWMKANDVNHILTTEKDATRIAPFLDNLDDACLWILPLSLEWSHEAKLASFLNDWIHSLPSQTQPIP